MHPPEDDPIIVDFPPAGAPLPDDPATLRALAQGYQDDDRPAEALPVLTRLAELTPDDPLPLLERMWTYLEAGEVATTRAEAAALLERFPASGEVAAQVGQISHQLGDDAAALALYQRAADLAGDDFPLLYRLALNYKMAGRPAAARALLDRLESWHPREVLLLRAEIQLDLDDAAGALADLARALAADPDESRPGWPVQSTAIVHLTRARAHSALHQPDAAEADTRAAIAILGDSPAAAEPWTVLAALAQERGDFAGAQAAAEQAVALNPHDVGSWLSRMTSQLGSGDLAGTLAIIRRAQVYHPTNHQLALTAMLLRSDMGDADGMIEEWDRLLALAPDDVDARAIRASLELRLGRLAAADADVAHALRLAPNHLIALETRARLLLEREDLVGALVTVNRVLALDPEAVEVLLLRGQVLLDVGNLIAAAADYTHVLQIQPENLPARVGLGHLQMETGQYEGALRDYEAALRQKPDSAGLLFNLATAHAALNHCPRALEVLRRAIAAEPELLPAANDNEFLAPCLKLPAAQSLLLGKRNAPAGKPSRPGGAKKGKRKR